MTLTRPQVARLLGVCRKTTYALEAGDPLFPKPAMYGKRKRWLRSDVIHYMQSKHNLLKTG